MHNEITFYTDRKISVEFKSKFEDQFGTELIADFVEGETLSKYEYFSNQYNEECETCADENFCEFHREIAEEMGAFWDVFNPKEATQWNLDGCGEWACGEIRKSDDYKKLLKKFSAMA